MICEFCGEEFAGRPVKQGDLMFCTILCANAAANISEEEDEDGYYEEDQLEFNSLEDEDSAY